MKITKAVITAAARKQRSLPLQTLIDRDGAEKSVLSIMVEEALRAGMERLVIVARATSLLCPGSGDMRTA
jgi:UTP--glucose-1-phosphate uridylyltransferase